MSKSLRRARALSWPRTFWSRLTRRLWRLTRIVFLLGAALAPRIPPPPPPPAPTAQIDEDSDVLPED
ncbi:MAG TPA: hypothetical protein VLT33_37035 [Labilithrix sp.]|nr:hypothetical protein [Labilithrix sp.]